MSSTYLAGSAVLVSGSSGLECEPSRSARLAHSAAASSRNTGRTSHATMTCEPSPLNVSGQTELFPTSSVEGSPAKTSAMSASARALMASAAASGQNTPELLARFDRDTLSWKTSQPYLDGDYPEFSETWPRSGLMRNGIAYQLPPLAFPMIATEFGLLPTPRANRGYQAYSNPGFAPSLTEILTGAIGMQNNGIKPHPCFVELLMGFPIGHSELNPLATQSSQKFQKSSDAR